MILDIKQIQMASQTTNQGGSPDMQCTARTNFLHKKIPYLHALQGNREMGARYLDPRYSRWISADPAMNMGEYFPQAPINDEAKKHNQNLPGLGGVFNPVNLNLYHYAGNNPIKYTDPDGRSEIYKRKMGSRSIKILGIGNFLGFRHYLFRGKFFKGNGRYSIYQFSQGGVSQYESSYFKNFEYEIVYSDLDEDIAEQAAQNVKNSVNPKTGKKYSLRKLIKYSIMTAMILQMQL